MKNIIIIYTFFIFFGCVTNRSFDNELKIKTPFNNKNIFPLLKVLREYELLEQDYFYYKYIQKIDLIQFYTHNIRILVKTFLSSID